MVRRLRQNLCARVISTLTAYKLVTGKIFEGPLSYSFREQKSFWKIMGPYPCVNFLILQRYSKEKLLLRYVTFSRTVYPTFIIALTIAGVTMGYMDSVKIHVPQYGLRFQIGLEDWRTNGSVSSQAFSKASSFPERIRPRSLRYVTGKKFYYSSKENNLESMDFVEIDVPQYWIRL